MIRKTLLLSSLAALPLVNNGSLLTTIDTTSKNVVDVNVDEQEEKEPEACTFMYVGKDVSENGKALIARCGDRGPNTMNMYAKVFQHNELANQVVEGRFGFKWQMPSTTYKYAATPRNKNMGVGLNWHVSGINENGVCVSATLSCETFHQLIDPNAVDTDPFVTTGISEDNYTQIVAATATSARNGIETVAKIIDTEGAADPDIIMIGDKNETWMMEIYSGHQYCAIKMPDDKACTMGNEFILDTLEDFKDEDIIHSKDLLTLPQRMGCAVYDDSGLKTLKHLHLYNTYGGDSYKDAEGKMVYVQAGFGDGSHMRTWIGQYRFGRKQMTSSQLKYENCKQPKTGKLHAFWTPDRKLNENDVISYMRDRYETILNDPEEPNGNYEYFKTNQAKLRSVGTETTYQVHIMSVDPTLPTEMSVNELMCLSSANYAPFVPINNSINSFTSYYERKVPEYSHDDKSAILIYRKLNGLASLSREKYGLPIESFIHEHELVWQIQYNDMINQVKGLSSKQIQEVMTNFCKSLQSQGLLLSKTLFDDLLFHIENTIRGQIPTHVEFKPMVSLEYYSKMYGWNYKYDSDKKFATVTRGNDTITADFNYKGVNPYGEIKYNGMSLGDEIVVHITDGEPYVQHSAISSLISGLGEVATYKYGDFFDKKINPALIVVPIVVGGILIAAAIVIPYVLNKRKTKKELAAASVDASSTTKPE